VLLLPEETAQIDLRDSFCGALKPPVQLDLATHLIGEGCGDVEGSQLSLPAHVQQELEVEMIRAAIGAPTIGPAALAPALDERARQHFPQSPQAADETAPGLEFWIAAHRVMVAGGGAWISDIINDVRIQGKIKT
jgi:hypothetical protein